MDRNTTATLWKLGQKDWNAWALLKRREREEAISQGRWQAIAESWMQDATADFSDQDFPLEASWYGLDFPGTALFRKARFKRADFRRAKFHGLANFSEASFFGASEFRWTYFASGADFYQAKFKQRVNFRHSKFDEQVEFLETAFHGVADFSHVAFLRSVDFSRSTFRSYVDFGYAKFPALASFEAIRSESSFSLAQSVFSEVPNFIAATFREPPRLDNAKILQPPGQRADHDQIAFYRKLRTMAISAHDYERERDYFVCELRARRGTVDRGWSATYLVGLIYGALSDYGRSIFRPVGIWLLSIAAFWACYYLAHLTSARPSATLSELLLSLNDLGSDCVKSSGWPFLKAGIISLKNALLIFPWDRVEQFARPHACLFGTVEIDGRSIPDIPDSVILLSIVQAAGSAILLFLVALGIRNHLRVG
jgi:hypothetical protein